jgi:hypothetical protein
MSIKFTVTENTIPAATRRIRRQLDNLPDEAYDVFYKETPIRTGNARSKTRLRGDTIDANYPYAQRLDDGYSRQSPRGMILPTMQYLRKRLRQIIGR